MTNPIQQTIENRVSVNHYQPNQPLSDDTITSLITLATKAPSAYNMQNWRFIAVRSGPAKARLKSVAYGQQKVEDASVSFIICGTLKAHQQLSAALQPSVDAGMMSTRAVDAWVSQASAAHADNDSLQRDEAIRSASLAAMTLMLAAEGMALGSCAMVGFDAAGLSQAFNLADTEVPVLIVTVGYPLNNNGPQKPRKATQSVLHIV